MTRGRAGPLGLLTAALAACGGAPAAGEHPADAAPLADAGPGDAAPLEVGIGPWTAPPDATAPVSLDEVTVYAFSQTSDDQRDPQVLALAPDMNMRAWQRWDTYGFTDNFDFDYVAAAHAAGVKVFMGGTTATALFADEFPNVQFPTFTVDDVDTRDATGAPVVHPKILPGLRRGSLANPDYRAYLIRIGELQIDGGVDGLYFDEVNQDYQGANFDGNEGFDRYHLADFNAYLLWRFPGADYQTMFGMTADNLLKADVPAGDLVHNFNYQRYLVSNGWAGSGLFSSSNPLAKIWGQTIGGRPLPGQPNFVDSAEPYRYWGDIVRALRAYAQQTYGRSIYLTANGIYPLVDFQGVGLFAYNTDDDGGAEAEYVPVTPGSTTTSAHLDGTRKLQRPFLNLKARSEALAPAAPVVVFLDWPNEFISYFFAMPAGEQQDYWRIYVAEAYANGIFFAFYLQDTVGDPNATALGLMPLYQSLAAFYRGHASFYHGVAANAAAASAVVTSLTTPVMIAVADQATPRRRLVHLVNHDYKGALLEHDGVTITIPQQSAPTSVTLASPDATGGDLALAWTYANGAVTVTLPSLVAYDVVAIAF